MALTRSSTTQWKMSQTRFESEIAPVCSGCSNTVYFISKVWEVDFTPPFKRVSMVTELEKQLSVTFPPPTEFASPCKPELMMFCICCT